MSQAIKPRRILIIEDEADIAQLIALHVAELPAEVCVVGDGVDGLQKALSGEWDALVLDLRLPRLGGLDICRELRAQGRSFPILMLTARGSELDRVLGLELGADDYLVKPFSVLELLARVKALWRRHERQALDEKSQSDEQPKCYDAGPLRLDRLERRAWLDDQELTLTPREFDLLWHFARHPKRVFTRAELLEQIWGYGHDGYDHTVNSHINRLRSKLGDDRAEARFIHTVWGVGYRFEVLSS